MVSKSLQEIFDEVADREPVTPKVGHRSPDCQQADRSRSDEQTRVLPKILSAERKPLRQSTAFANYKILASLLIFFYLRQSFCDRC